MAHKSIFSKSDSIETKIDIFAKALKSAIKKYDREIKPEDFDIKLNNMLWFFLDQLTIKKKNKS